MCATCGCSDDTGTRIDGVAVPGHDHSHGHEHSHGQDHARGHGHTHTVELEQDVLAKNDHLAGHNRAWLDQNTIRAVNIMSSPGSGKTTLLERTITGLGAEGVSVVEGDQEPPFDADRIRAPGCRAVQINTGAGCHLDAQMLSDALRSLDPPRGSVVLIENVGNLVCPALFDLGEHARVVVMSVPEGEDKPIKYPHMFRGADLVLLNKVDLLPHLDFDMDRFLEHLRRVNPGAALHPVSATRGEGLQEWYAWLGAHSPSAGTPVRAR
ncbi:hydrogenase nickel incorporation protein HypB [Nocardiopsis salina]|uniref:hydrogenase nickel incorporation protein HypB n=1 Tax=Nocardiopsis salina TaxID=245836 RepID=UPI000347A9E5|nr:hydrogenase nickel incorporation protein HypB [Nocardiopsis salina]